MSSLNCPCTTRGQHRAHVPAEDSVKRTHLFVQQTFIGPLPRPRLQGVKTLAVELVVLW